MRGAGSSGFQPQIPRRTRLHSLRVLDVFGRGPRVGVPGLLHEAVQFRTVQGALCEVPAAKGVASDGLSVQASRLGRVADHAADLLPGNRLRLLVRRDLRRSRDRSEERAAFDAGGVDPLPERPRQTEIRVAGEVDTNGSRIGLRYRHEDFHSVRIELGVFLSDRGQVPAAEGSAEADQNDRSFSQRPCIQRIVATSCRIIDTLTFSERSDG